MYLAKRHSWSSCLAYNAAVLLAIKNGMKCWGDSFDDLEYFCQLHQDSDSDHTSENFKQTSSSDSDDSCDPGVVSKGIWYCNRFNKGKCTMDQCHSQYFFKSDTTRTVEHICSHCLMLDGSKQLHSCLECPRNPSGWGPGE